MNAASIRSWIAAVLGRSAIERDLNDELRFHIDQYADDLVRKGVDPVVAARRARAEFGAVEARKDECREALGLRLIDEVRQDVRYAFRQLRRSPGFTVVVVLTLTLGIGANTAIFSVVRALLLKPLPYAAASNRLVRVMSIVPAGESFTGAPLRLPVSLSADEMGQVLSEVPALADAGGVGPVLLRLSDDQQAARVQGARVSSSMFRILQAHALEGRTFQSRDDERGAEPVAILSFALWQQRFRGDRAVDGRTVTLATTFLRPVERQFVVVGVMPQGFMFPDNQTQLWIPPQSLVQAPAANAPTPLVRLPMLAVLAEGASLEAAAAQVEPLVRRMRNIKPSTDMKLVRERDEIVTSIRPALLVLTVAVGFVLLIACVNVANLVLARTAARQREIAIRASIGAGSRRLLRQAMTESIVLAFLGGAVAMVFATVCVRLLRSLATTLPRFDLANGLAFPRLNEISMDLSVVGFAVAVSVVTGLACGLVPAFRHTRCDPSSALKDGSGTSTSANGSSLRLRGRQTLVVAQIALATVLLVGAGLLIRSFVRLSQVTPGYDPKNVLTFQVDVPSRDYPDARLLMFAEEVSRKIRSLPGVQSVAAANQLPMVNMKDTGGGFWKTANPNRGATPVGDCRIVSRDYLKAMGIRVVAGRGFGDGDGAGQPRVLLINQALARHDFANEDPIGKLVFIGSDPSPWQVVGVIADVRQFGLERDPEPQFFVDQRQWSPVSLHLFPVGMYFAVRTSADPNEFAARIATIARDIDPQAVVFNVASMEEIVSTTIAKPRMYAVLLGMFAAVGVLLAVIGIYGVMAYSVTRRTHEFGIHMALGAQASRVLGLVLRQGLVLALLGIFIGIAGAVLVNGYLTSLLFGLKPLDAATYAGVPVLFAFVALVASYVPARRATRIDPLVALRTE